MSEFQLKNMKNLITLFLTLLMLSSSLNLSAQPRPKVAPKPKVEQLEILDDVNDFDTKGLPIPPVIGSNPSDELAAELAKKISKYDEDSYPLLVATIQKAGFYIIDENQKMLYKPIYGNGLGLAFYDFEIAGMYKAARSGAATSIKTMADILSDHDNNFSSSELSKLILTDLQNGATSKNPEYRFLSKLIIEIGKNSEKPTDLMTANPENAAINLIQASLIERLLIGDLIAEYEKLNVGNAVFRPKTPVFNPMKEVNFVNASFIRNLDGCEAVADVTNLVKTQRTIYKATDKIAYFKALMDAIADPEKAKGVRLPTSKLDPKKLIENRFEHFGKGVSVLNAVASFTKLVTALLNLKGELTVEEPQPLIRTKSSRKPGGEVRIVTAKFTMDLPNAKKINCVGKALELGTGIKFSVPKNGAMADKPVSWELLTEGTGYRKYVNTPVYLDALDKSDTSRQSTDSSGISKVKLTGKPQASNLENEAVVPIPKSVVLRVGVATEKMDLKEDAAKIGKVLLINANPLSMITGAIEFIPEIAGKMQLRHFNIRVPIRDWSPCSEDWGGIINVKREFTKTTIIRSSKKSNGNSTGDGNRTIKEYDEADITLNPRKPEEVAANKPENPADVYVKGEHSDIFEGLREADPCCGKTEGSFNTKFKEGTERKFSTFIKQIINVGYRGTERDYSLSFSNMNFTFETNLRKFLEVDSTCDLEDDEAKSEELTPEITLYRNLMPGRYGQRITQSGTELLAGEKIFNESNGAITTWKWELARCK